MNELKFDAGHVFFEAGDPGQTAWFVHEGEVELLTGPDTSPVRARIVRSGDVFGEQALVDERPRDVTARALTGGRVVAVAREEFERTLFNAPAPIRECLRTLFERLRAATHDDDADFQFADEAFLADDGFGIDASTASGPGESAAGVPSQFPVSQGRAGEWIVVVHPLTRKAAETLPEEGLLVTQFPLRLGRAAAADENEALDLNDLWLLDDEPFNVSRNHCEIYVDGVGPAIRDRGSALGCVVNETSIGGRGKMRNCGLERGDNVVILGSRVSPYQFRITVERR
ncbi:HTH-type transcriptional regulator Cmr [Caulifigura coniformis]|uniref:HTH-type transcriptional regulator Cmr n=1 Tax=Caulifigura coniformis TaxID=2527983 RepID=A0A517SMQ3_9PLAN|nr:cyclic nucleotide-binding domain-containing protein [Caulifigura coniformis]QDT57398.1 HTH-type transcriptional regulator Cmr [Caulifigura coniformis]